MYIWKIYLVDIYWQCNNNISLLVYFTVLHRPNALCIILSLCSCDIYLSI